MRHARRGAVSIQVESIRDAWRVSRSCLCIEETLAARGPQSARPGTRSPVCRNRGDWQDAAGYPNKLAAVVPLTGNGNVPDLRAMRYVAGWAFPGEADGQVPRWGHQPRDTLNSVCKPRASPPAKLTRYPGVGNDSWARAYATFGAGDSSDGWLLHSRWTHGPPGERCPSSGEEVTRRRGG